VRVSFLVPAYNEAATIVELLEHVTALDLEKQIVVVDDGSTDGTSALLAAADDMERRLRTITLSSNRGKGAAVRAGMLAARSNFALMTDVDLSTPLDDLEKLVIALGDEGDVAIASRALKESQVIVHQPAHRELMGKTFNVFVRVLTRVPWHDTQCGFKLFRLERSRCVFELQRVEGFAFDLDILVTARRLGLAVSEVPVTWVDNPDTHVGLFSSSVAMAVDAVRIAYRARRPMPPLPAGARLVHGEDERARDDPRDHVREDRHVGQEDAVGLLPHPLALEEQHVSQHAEDNERDRDH